MSSHSTCLVPIDGYSLLKSADGEELEKIDALVVYLVEKPMGYDLIINPSIIDQPLIETRTISGVVRATSIGLVQAFKPFQVVI